jgi:hypothetical protein
LLLISRTLVFRLHLLIPECFSDILLNLAGAFLELPCGYILGILGAEVLVLLCRSCQMKESHHFVSFSHVQYPVYGYTSVCLVTLIQFIPTPFLFLSEGISL